MSLNAELIVAYFQQQSATISNLIEKQEKQNAEFKEIIAKQADEIVELKKILSLNLYYMDENIAEFKSKHEDDLSYLKRSISDDIAQLKKKQEKQEKKMKKQERKIEGQNHVIYQLLAGLFDQKTQSGILNMHLSDIGESTNENQCTRVDTSIWRQYPTTRQGDQSERRIDVIEKTLMNIGRIIAEQEPYKEELPYKEEVLEEQVNVTETEDLKERMKKLKEENYFGHFQNLERELQEKNEMIEELREQLELALMKEETVSESSRSSSTFSVRRMQNTFDLCGNE